MKDFVVLIASLFSINTFAAVAAPEIALNDSHQTYFDALGDWFNAGTNITPDSIRGQIWSGRCFDKWSPNIPFNTELVTSEKSNSDVGPGFPYPTGPIYFEEISHWNNKNQYLPADYYDDDKALKASRIVVEDAVAAKQLSAATIDANGNLTATLDFEPNSKPDILSSLKQYENYLILNESNLIENNTLWSGSQATIKTKVPIGSVFRCYYFKQLAR